MPASRTCIASKFLLVVGLSLQRNFLPKPLVKKPGVKGKPPFRKKGGSIMLNIPTRYLTDRKVHGKLHRYLKVTLILLQMTYWFLKILTLINWA
jgi:hypothetical protein